jgi:phage host-nuclease inhibitor protein Gam
MRQEERNANQREVERLERINRQQKESKEAELQAKIKALEREIEEKKEQGLLDIKATNGKELAEEGVSDVGNALKGLVKGYVGVSKIIAAPITGAINLFRNK